MSEILKNKRCHLAGCKAHEGGKCADGFDLEKEDCPNFYIDDANSDVPESNNIPEKPSNNIKLFNGKEFSYNQIYQITQYYDTKLIFIIGEFDSGKTTLLAEYFINFQRGNIKDYSFAGSFTQIGFEERCFRATLSSMLKKPDTLRTFSKEFSFLHLAIKNQYKKEDRPIHFLLSDVSGERYREARKSSASMKELYLLKSADKILYVIDGDKLQNIETRHLTIDEVKTFIKNAIDNGIFDKKTKLKVVISKWDLIPLEEAATLEEKIQTMLNERYKQNLGELIFDRIAVRPNINNETVIEDLYKLLNHWASEGQVISENIVPKEIISKRFFNNYKERSV